MFWAVFAHHQEHLTVFTASGNIHQCRCRLVSWISYNVKSTDPCAHVTLSTLHVPMNPRTGQFSPSSPRQTRENPIMAPTMLWLPDTGNFRNVALSSNTELPTVTIWLSWCVATEHTASHPLSVSVSNLQEYCHTLCTPFLPHALHD